MNKIDEFTWPAYCHFHMIIICVLILQSFQLCSLLIISADKDIKFSLTDATGRKDKIYFFTIECTIFFIL
jgi:hypothetical protein